MEKDFFESMRGHAEDIFKASLKAVHPRLAVEKFVRWRGDLLEVGPEGGKVHTFDPGKCGRVIIVGAGKATAPMAGAVEDILGPRLDSGLIIVKYGFTEPLKKTRIIEADHPLPDERGMEGTKEVLSMLRETGEDDLVFSLISGGGSALFPLPAGEITLSEKQAVTRMLIECGAGIHEINAVRKHISSSKGGRMAEAAYPATVVNLMLSDVVGDRTDVIASGPFVPDDSSFKDAWGVFEKYALKDIPDSVSRHIKAGLEDRIPETPKKDDRLFEKVHNFIVGSNIIALESARKRAEELGYNTMILSSMIEGETRLVAGFHTAIARESAETGRPVPPPACIISGGETTVTIRGHGLGGRNQEFCLAAAIDLARTNCPAVILSCGTDGNDGPTDAAGAAVDPFSVARGLDAGADAEAFLSDNDSYHYFQKTGELVMTGPTNTNVMDVRVVLVKKGK